MMMMYDANNHSAPDEDVESQLLSKTRRRVRFQEENDVRLIPSFDESLKGDLFYSRADYAMFLAYFEVFQFEECVKERNARGMLSSCCCVVLTFKNISSVVLTSLYSSRCLAVTRAIRLLVIVLMIWFAARKLISHEVA